MSQNVLKAYELNVCLQKTIFDDLESLVRCICWPRECMAHVRISVKSLYDFNLGCGALQTAQGELLRVIDRCRTSIDKTVYQQLLAVVDAQVPIEENVWTRVRLSFDDEDVD